MTPPAPAQPRWNRLRCLAAALAGVSILLAACGRPPVEPSRSLREARAGFATKLSVRYAYGEAPARPPPGTLAIVSYPGPLGPMAAYITPDPKDGRRHPAILWLAGGFSNSIGPLAWTPGPPENDQSAWGFRDFDLVVMYPSLRGGNNNPGHVESCFGEVDDVLAAAEHLATLPWVDPERIYLGGHSTGGTLALLVAETGTCRFRAVFALGPVASVAAYGPEALSFDPADDQEVRLRSPIHWMAAVRCPTFVFEGTTRGNLSSLRAMEKACRNPRLRFFRVFGGDHYDIIAPLVQRIGQQIAADHGPAPAFEFPGLAGLVPRRQKAGGR